MNEEVVINFMIKRCSFPTLIKVIGTCKSSTVKDELLIASALGIMEKLAKFGGIVYQKEESPQRPSSEGITIYFHMIFPTEADVLKVFEAVMNGDLG